MGMMKKIHKKRKVLDEANELESTPAKQRKSSDFNVVEFKLLLKQPATTFQAIERFINQASLFPDQTDYDIISSYSATANGGNEFFGLFESSHKKPSQLCLLFEALEAILLRIASDLKKYKALGDTIAKSILSYHLPAVYAMLAMSNTSNQIKSAVKLLTAIVIQGRSRAKDVLLHFDFAHRNVYPLLNRRDTKDIQDVRKCYIQFLMSFFIIGDNDLIKHLLDMKDVVQPVFDGLYADKATTLCLVLSTLLEKVVRNPVITKTHKLRLFTDHALKEITRLYSWRGAASWTGATKKKTPAAGDTEITDERDVTDDQRTVRQACHEFLTDLVCSHATGIGFLDNSFATSGRNTNRRLTGLLNVLPLFHGVDEAEQLAVSLISAYPDQMHWYLPSLKTQLTPRLSTQWVASIQLLCQVIEHLPRQLVPKIARQPVDVSKMVSMLLMVYVPPKDIWALIGYAIRKPEQRVRHESLCVLRSVLQLFAHNLRTLTDISGQHNSDLCQKYREAMIRILPDVDHVIQCWRLASSTPSSDKTLNESEAAVDGDKQVAESNNVSSAKRTGGVVEVAATDHLTVILEVLCLYYSTQPSLARSNPVNVASILQGVKSVSAADDSDTTVLLVLTLRLLATSDFQQIAWLKAFGGQSTVYLVLEIILRTRDSPKLNAAAIKLVHQLLMGTRLFDVHGDELSVWLKQLAAPHVTGTVVQLVESMLSAVLKHPLRYEEQVMSAVCPQASLSADSQHTSPLSVAEILALPEDTQENENCGNDDVTSVSSPSAMVIPFSVLLPACVEMLKEQQTPSREVMRYVHDVLRTLIRQQADCGSLALYVSSKCPASVLVDLQCHLAPWLPDPSHEASDADIEELLEGESVNVVDVLEAIFESKQMPSSEDIAKLSTFVSKTKLIEVQALVHQLLLYIETLTNRKMTKEIKRQITLYFNMLEKVIESTAVRTNPAATDDDGSVSKDEAIVDLLVDDLQAELVLQAVCAAIGNNQALSAYFLWQKSDNGPTVKNDKHMLAVSRVLTVLVAQLLASCTRVAASLTGSSLASKLDVFVAKLNRCCSDSERIAGDLGDLVLEALTAAISCLSSDSLVKLIESLLSLPADAYSNDSEDAAKCSLLHLALEQWMGKTEEGGDVMLSAKALTALANLTCVLASDALASDLHSLLKAFPLYGLCVECSLFEDMMNSVALLSGPVSVVVSVNKQANKWLTTWLQANSSTLDSGIRQPLLHAVSTAISCQDVTDKKLVKSAKKLFWNEACDWICGESQLTSANQPMLRMLTCLCRLDQLAGAREDLRVRLAKHLQQTGASVEQVTMLHRLTELVSDTAADGMPEASVDFTVTTVKTLSLLLSQKSARSTIVACLQLLSPYLQKLKAAPDEHQTQTVLKVLRSLWTAIIRNGLKCHYGCDLFLHFLCDCVKLVYASQQGDVLPLKSVYDMLLAHSQYLPTVLGKHSSCKVAVLRLQLTLARMDKSCCQTEHIGALLGSYSAKLHLADRYLLSLLHTYEDAGCKLDQFKPYVWGAKAMEIQSVRKSLGPSLWKQTTVDEVISLLDQDTLHQSTVHFHLNTSLQLNLDDNKTFDEANSTTSEVNRKDLYDVQFLFPLFSHLLQPENVVDCRLFAEHGCLAYIVMGLCSQEASVRGCACHLLVSFSHQLYGARFAEQPLITYLLDTLRRSMPSANKKLPPVICLFFARASKLVFNQANALYSPVVEFLLLKPSVDITNIPEFYKLFNSSAADFHAERLWMLSLMEDGLREPSDFHLYEKRYAFKLLLSLYESSMSDTDVQVHILRIIRQACSMDRVAMLLVESHLLIGWLSAVALLPNLTEQHLSLLVNIVTTVSKTLAESPQLSSIHLCQIQLLLKMFISCHGFGFLAFSQYNLGNELHLSQTQFEACVKTVADAGKVDAVPSVSANDLGTIVYQYSCHTSDPKWQALLSPFSRTASESTKPRKSVKGLFKKQLKSVEKLSSASSKVIKHAEEENELVDDQKSESQDVAKSLQCTAGITHIANITCHWKPGKSESDISLFVLLLVWCAEKLDKHSSLSKSHVALGNWLKNVLTEDFVELLSVAQKTSTVRAVMRLYNDHRKHVLNDGQRTLVVDDHNKLQFLNQLTTFLSICENEASSNNTVQIINSVLLFSRYMFGHDN